jgi:hypothetical protein
MGDSNNVDDSHNYWSVNGLTAHMKQQNDDNSHWHEGDETWKLTDNSGMLGEIQQLWTDYGDPSKKVGYGQIKKSVRDLNVLLEGDKTKLLPQGITLPAGAGGTPDPNAPPPPAGLTDDEIAQWKTLEGGYVGLDQKLSDLQSGAAGNEDGTITGDNKSVLSDSAEARQYRNYLERQGWLVLVKPPAPDADKNAAPQKKPAEQGIAVNAADFGTGVADDPAMQLNQSGTLDEYGAAVDACKDKLDGLGDLTEIQQTELQLAMERRSKFIETLSNLMKKKDQTDEAIVANMK